MSSLFCATSAELACGRRFVKRNRETLNSHFRTRMDARNTKVKCSRPYHRSPPREETTTDHTREGTAPGELPHCWNQVPPMVSYSAKGINRFTAVNFAGCQAAAESAGFSPSRLSIQQVHPQQPQVAVQFPFWGVVSLSLSPSLSLTSPCSLTIMATCSS